MAAPLGIPVLPVHDEVIIPVSAKRAIELMLARAAQHVLKSIGDIRTVREDGTVKGEENETMVVALAAQISSQLGISESSYLNNGSLALV